MELKEQNILIKSIVNASAHLHPELSHNGRRLYKSCRQIFSAFAEDTLYHLFPQTQIWQGRGKLLLKIVACVV